MIRLDKHGRVLSGGFNGESLPSYADEVTHGLGEAKPAGEKVRSFMAKASAKRKEKAKQTAVQAAIHAQSKQAFKNLIAAKRLSDQAAKARKLEAAKAKVRVAASKQRTLGFDFSGLIGDPLAGFDQAETILASTGLLGEGLYDDVSEGEDFGNTTLGAPARKSPPKLSSKAKIPGTSTTVGKASKALADKNSEQNEKLKLIKDAGIKNPETFMATAGKSMSLKQVKEYAAKAKKKIQAREEKVKKFEAIAQSRLPVLPAGEKRPKQHDVLFNVFFIQAALEENKKYHDTDKKYKSNRELIDSRVKKIDKIIDSMQGKSRKEAENNRDYIKNEISKSHTKAIERTIAWRKKNGKCGFLGADCIFPPDPLLIVGAAVLIVGAVVAGPAILAAVQGVAGAAASGSAAISSTVGSAAASASSALGLGASGSTLVGTAATTAATGAIKSGVDSLVPKEIKDVGKGVEMVSSGADTVSSAASGDIKAPSSEQVVGAAGKAAKRQAEKRVATAAKMPASAKKKVVDKAKGDARKLAVKNVAAQAKIPEASIKAVVEGRTPPTPVPPTIAEMAKKQVADTEQATLAIVEEQTGIKTGAENPLWTSKDIAEEVSPQQLKAGGFAPVQAQAKLANAAEGLGVQIADKPDLTLSKEERNKMAAQVAKSEHVTLTAKYEAMIKAGKDVELAKSSKLPATSIKNLELKYAEAAAQYEKAKLASGIKVAAAAQGRFELTDRHPMARFF